MEAFPAFFPLAGQHIVIAGEGEPAEAKARLFEGSPARVTRVTGAAACDPATYAGARLVFVTSYDAAFRGPAAAAARAAGALVNVVDDPAMCDFHTPAIIDRGQLVAAIGTAGASPLMAALLRGQMEALVPESAGQVAALLGARREAVRQAFPDLADRRGFLRAVLNGPVARAAAAGDMAWAETHLDEAIAAGWAGVGRVTFVEGVAVADLVSLRAVRALDTADVIVAGEDAAAFLADHGRRDAERPASADAETLAALARAGRLVAVVGERADLGLVQALRALEIAVEVLSPASAS